MKFSKIITLAINSAKAFSWIGISNARNEMTGQNEDICTSTGLTRGQKRLCQQTPEYSVAIKSVARLSLVSCHQELGSACPKAVSKLPKLTGDLKWPSAESGYLHGLSSGELKIKNRNTVMSKFICPSLDILNSLFSKCVIE